MPSITSKQTKGYKRNEHQATAAAADGALTEAVKSLTQGRTKLCIAYQANKGLGRQLVADKIRQSADQIERIVKNLKSMTDD